MDCSYKNIRLLLDVLIDLRKNAPIEISDIYARHNKEILKYLKGVQISLQTNREITNCNIEPFSPFENLHMKQDRRLPDKIYEQIQLLKILIEKKNCPISKIIDDI